jgi:4-amino-4-deoxy-L-arabinose transferase-like glycosyltransferase
MKSQERTWLIILAAIALIVKLGYLFWALDNPTSVGHLSVDALYHYKWASLIASGEFLTNAPYFRAPLYPFITALLLKISGDSLIFIRLVQLLAGCLTLIIIYRIASAVAGRMAGILSFLFFLLYPITTYYEGELLLDSIFTLFALLSLYFFIYKKDDRDRPLMAGLFFALAALTRPTILVFLPVVAIYYLCRWPLPQARRETIKALVLFLIITTVLIAPVTIINYLASDQLILISYQGGVNFHIGNNPEADGLSSTLPEAGKDWDIEDADYLAYKESGRRLHYGEQSAFWYKKGLDYIIDNPGQAFKLFTRKLYFLFSGHEVSNNRPLDQVVFQNSLLSFLPIRFSILAALAILPLFLANDNRKTLYTLYGLVLLYGITVAVFFVSSRFRLPIVPLIAIIASWGLTSLWDTIREKQIDARLFFAVVGSAGFFILASSTIFPISLVNPEQSLFLRGNQSLRHGDFSTAVARFDSLVQWQPDYKNAHLNLGIARLKMGDVDNAAVGFRQELEHNPNSAEAANNLGVIFLLRQEDDSARFYCRQALRVKPYYTEAAINFLRTARRESNTETLKGVEEFRQEIRRANQDKPAYIFEEGLYFTDHKRINEAIDNHLRIVEILSIRQPSVTFDFAYNDAINPLDKYLKLACYQLGYLYGLSGDLEPSIRFSRRAIELDPDLKEAYINLISGYRSSGRVRLADSVATEYLSRWPDP